jgi:alanine-glyoxylate transaminase/serine-glyoxylate transaminase/serine-pyruvate transaminase
MCLTAISIAEMALVEAGARIKLGSGVAAAQEVYLMRPAQPELRLAAE